MRVEEREPRWTHGKAKLQFSRGQINASTGNGFGVEANESIRAETVVHVVPKAGQYYY